MDGECLEPEQSMKEGGDARVEQTIAEESTAGQTGSGERAENAESTLGESARIDSAPPPSRQQQQTAQNSAHSVFGVCFSSAPSSGGGLALGEGLPGNEPREQQQSV